MADITEDLDDRRTSLRVDMEAERIGLAWHDVNGQQQLADGICIDLSRRGVLIEYKSGFKVGELLEVTFNPDNDKKHTVKGQVCRTISCSPQGFHIAIQLL
ncbi:PilZ domain-containing protein [Shewanella eurypsychrophilus]|uniref:PilZ domain-containing protein n=1 Tax=Shewanella eurypsychrophilus TaxID=2593656 RepID=A0ABX6V7I7_9GAMM|nr:MULTISPECIES: PilZ domain-containing protein [Shewanella]QFU23358.1 PilZ domain-containing protein [Shewanella sp. YLB-09]QPG58589.1 PilZ domain-containing protein [Shewanella eurypsychrophilus]